MFQEQPFAKTVAAELACLNIVEKAELAPSLKDIFDPEAIFKPDVDILVVPIPT